MPNARYFATNSADYRAALRQAWYAAPDDDGTLLTELLKNEKSARLLSSDPLQSSSSNGHSSSSMLPGDGAPAPIEDARLWSDLIQLYEQSVIWLKTGLLFDTDSPETSFVYYTREGDLTTDDLPIASPTDVQIDAAMRNSSLLVGVSETRGDYSSARVQSGMQFI